MRSVHVILMMAVGLVTMPLMAQKSVKGNLNVINSRVQKEGDRLNIDFALDYSDIEISSNDELIVRPLIIEGRDTVSLPLILFPGKTRDKVNHRKVRLYGKEGMAVQPYKTVYSRQEGESVVEYRQQVPFRDWMYGARLELQREVVGCADCRQLLAAIPLSVIPEQARVAFVYPQPYTNQEENLVLYVRFPWDKAIIFRDFGNNADELAKIDRSIRNFADTRSGELQQIVLTGYASPEGAYDYNDRLAGRRAAAVKDYIQDKFRLDDAVFEVHVVPEDWQGVRAQVDSSAMKYRPEILNIIDGVANPDTRDLSLRRLDGNTTYRYLLRHVYPPLRRVECGLNYKVEPMTLEASKEMLQQHPERLSLYEIYQVARSYPQGSPQFNDIILMAVKLYPDDDIANNNAAAVALENNKLQQASSYLQHVKNEQTAWNNKGILLLQQGNIPEAKTCFEKAKACGCAEADHNLKNVVYLYSNN